MRLIAVLRLSLFVVFAVAFVGAQSTNGTVIGIVLDPSGKAIPDADIQIVNVGIRRSLRGQVQ